jgi:hypothetical protein
MREKTQVHYYFDPYLFFKLMLNKKACLGQVQLLGTMQNIVLLLVGLGQYIHILRVYDVPAHSTIGEINNA